LFANRHQQTRGSDACRYRNQTWDQGFSAVRHRCAIVAQAGSAGCGKQGAAKRCNGDSSRIRKPHPRVILRGTGRAFRRRCEAVHAHMQGIRDANHAAGCTSYRVWTWLQAASREVAAAVCWVSSARAKRCMRLAGGPTRTSLDARSAVEPARELRRECFAIVRLAQVVVHACLHAPVYVGLQR